MRHPGFAKASRIAAYTAIGATALLLSAGAAGLRYNGTPSIPLGFYRTAGADVRKGDYVLFCPPDRLAFRIALERRYIEPGDCPSGSYPMMKRILAAKGDRVTIGPDGVTINGVAVPNSKPRPHDGSKRPLPAIRESQTLTDGDVIVMGENPVSYDSRYFGPIPRQQISSALRPLYTW